MLNVKTSNLTNLFNLKLEAAVVVAIEKQTSKNACIVSATELAGILANIHGHTFCSTVEMMDMTAKKRMNKGRGSNVNPWMTSGLFKRSVKQLTVNFNYEAKREKRGGDAPAKPGNWQQAFMLDGKLTPLTAHKGDCIVDNDQLPIADQTAQTDADGTTMIAVDEPRLYLRYEIQRDAGDGNRQDKAMRSTSSYFKADGETALTDAEVETVKPWLKKQSRTDETDFQLTSLDALRSINIDGMTYIVSSR